jgi:ribonuclease HII
LAKVERDRWCEGIDQSYPNFGFAQHKGYGTAAHLSALQTHGPTIWHRRSFAPVTALLNRAKGVS